MYLTMLKYVLLNVKRILVLIGCFLYRSVTLCGGVKSKNKHGLCRRLLLCFTSRHNGRISTCRAEQKMSENMGNTTQDCL